jgi:hypothetical protein
MSWGASQVTGAPGGRVRPGEGRETPCRFLLAGYFPCQHHPLPHLWPWSTPGTGHLGRNSILPGQYDPLGKFPIFREDSQFKPYVQRFRYTNDLEKLAKGRTVASNFAFFLTPFKRKVFYQSLEDIIQGFLSSPEVLCACGFRLSYDTPLPISAGLGSLSSTTLRFLGSEGQVCQNFCKNCQVRLIWFTNSWRLMLSCPLRDNSAIKEETRGG